MKALLAVLVLGAALPALAEPSGADDASVKRGRYLVHIAGCNDCHTPAYGMRDGKVPESEWLTGDALGWRGPWGTTYAPNLRLTMSEMTEEQWVRKAKSLATRPPMPWFNVRAMSTADLRAIYRYVRYLGPAGKPAPAYVPPDRVPPKPYAQFP